MGAAYVVAAWLVIQVVETILPAFGFGDAAVRLVTIVLAIGLVPVLVLTWAFELTPEGLKKDVDADHARAPAPSSGKKLDRFIMGVLALSLGYFAFDKFVLDPARDEQIARTASETATEQALDQIRQERIDDKSIAVLPFINRSEASQDQYFTDGMHDELLTRLALIDSLKVISRTSVLKYRNTELTIPEIADELAVGTVLEGGVQRVGNQVRINVQLINAQTDEHLWAEIFDRELTAENLFAIQSEISMAIAQALEAELSPAAMESIAVVPTRNAEAYDLYLQAIEERWKTDADFIGTVVPLLERSIELDPEFLLAHVELVHAYGRIFWNGADPDRVFSAKALDLVTQVRERWPDRIETNLAQGYYYYTVERDYTRALEEYRAVTAVFPNNVEALNGVSSSLKRQGRVEEQLPYARRRSELDPENSDAAVELLIALRLNGMVEETIALAEEGTAKYPEDNSWFTWLSRFRLHLLGDVEGYLAYGQILKRYDAWYFAGSDLSWLLFGEGEVDTAIEHVESRIGEREYGWHPMAEELDKVMILQAAGRDSEAQAAADHAMDFIKSELDAGRPFPDSRIRYWYVWSSLAAALAGDREAAAMYHEKALDAAEDGFINERLNITRMAQIDALLGEAATGWDKIVTAMEDGYPMITPEFAAVHPQYKYLFGEVPAFQAYVARATFQ